MRKHLKVGLLYAAWMAYIAFGYAAFAGAVVDKAATEAIVHTYKLTGANVALYNVHVYLGTIYHV